MHHKVFIIDAGREDAVVILGSYNPTKNGNTRNDENLLIIHELSIAQQFHEEFVRVSN
jgi:phosphatidylserine/phosphatidylglycerophosphate/cardiolipin synthase-like enzyme